MKIESVRIENFRSYKDETIVLDDYTCFVGPNGSGKLPVLIEDKKKEIKTDTDKPTNILIEGVSLRMKELISEDNPLNLPQCRAKMKIVPAIEACLELAEGKTNFISISRRIQVQHHLFIFGCFFSYCLRVQRAYPTIIVTPIIIIITASINSHLLF